MNNNTIVYKAGSRGYANHGWLQSFHTFSFAGYYNPERMHFGALRVLNDDRVSGNEGFDTHPHRDMEIVSVPLVGNLKHEDSEGNKHVISPGEIQIMSAGTGIYHSEYNASEDEEVRFLQIWVVPKLRGIKPRYGQRVFDTTKGLNRFQTLVSPDGREESLTINQDAFFSMAKIEAGQSVQYTTQMAQNGVYVFVIDGEVIVNDETLEKRDALGITAPSAQTTMKAKQDSQVLIIEVPMLKLQ